MSTCHPDPVFVVGYFRSGTSLLYSLLNQHSDIGLMYECDVQDFPGLLSGLRFRCRWLERQEFVNWALSRHRLTLNGSMRGLEHVKTPEALYRVVSEGKGAAVWGEKSPTYCARLAQLSRRYPGARLVLLWRDPVEIYRSVVSAGRGERYFRRPGMLSRLIHAHEQMIRQATRLSAAGFRIHHVTYNDLVDRTEQTCRSLCEFLGIAFDERMLMLKGADFSAVYNAGHHLHLRKGVIERRRHDEEMVTEPVHDKLRRFSSRWSRLLQERFHVALGANGTAEPGWLERIRHRVVGGLLFRIHNFNRGCVEFLPLPWLKAYRQLKAWLWGRSGPVSASKPSFRQELAEHWVTIFASWAILAVVATVQFFCNPHYNFIPFYLVPCAIVTLVINKRWGLLAAATASFASPLLKGKVDPDFSTLTVMAWNCAMRLVLFSIVVVLLDRVRSESVSVPGERI